MARCPNCARAVRFWHNHSGYCSKQCRNDSITSCPNCGKVGLLKHARLGCCSDECRFWYVANLLGYDKEALLTPAWDKVVYHVRLPSTSAEISSLQLDELEYDRAADTVLVIAAPPWMMRGKVLAELPYDRFDNGAWQHLWADGTLTEDELFKFHRICYDDDLLCQKLGEHVFAKLRQPLPSQAAATPPPGYYEPQALPLLASTQPMTPSIAPAAPQRQIAAPLTAPDEFVASVRAVFEDRGYTVTSGPADSSLALSRHGRQALAVYRYHSGLLDVEPVQHAFAAGAAAGASTTFVVTNGHFTLQAEDFAATRPMQLIDGDELASLAARRREMPTAPMHGELTPVLTPAPGGNSNGYGAGANGENGIGHAEVTPAPDDASVTAQISVAGKLAPVDAEVVGTDGPMDGTP